MGGRVSRFSLFLAIAMALGSAAHAQEWNLDQDASIQSPSALGLLGQRSVRVWERAPGEFSVLEALRGTGAAVDACINRTRTGRLEGTGDRQVLTVAPAMTGCPEVRYVFEADGSGREESRAGGQWVATGARLIGKQHVATSRAIPQMATDAPLAVASQDWDYRMTQSGAAAMNGTTAVASPERSVHITESAPGELSVNERTPLVSPGNVCINRPRKGRLQWSGQRQLVTVAPAMGGCPEVRFVFEPDGSGWEEENNNGTWVATGGKLTGASQVKTALARPAQDAAVAALPAAPAVATPAAAPQPVASPVPVPEPHRESASVVAGNRRALVIGNDNYRYVSPLLNARADALAIAGALARSGFRVTTKLDLDERSMKVALREFRNTVEGGDEVVVFYAGHGVQVGGANYLLPVDIHGDSEDQVRDDATPLQRILDDLADRRARFTLAVVDACRDNPFKGSGRAAIGARGLAPTTAATGQMVIYSAGSGQQALDKLGPADKSPNGLFTRVFLREMETPGVPVDRVLRNVRSEVGRLARSVGHTQTPALYDQTEGDFYLRRTP